MADLTKQELATVLFALRFLQANKDDEEVDELMRESEHFTGETFKPMNHDEIDRLCEDLNSTATHK